MAEYGLLFLVVFPEFPLPPLNSAVMDVPRLSPTDYQLLVEQSPILIWRADLSMGCDYFNERWLAFTGRTMTEEYGNGWATGVHPEDLQRCLEIYTNSFSRRQIFEMEYRLRRYDGAYRWLLDRGVPVYDSNKAFIGFVGSCIDVTERYEAQAALKAAHDEALSNLHRLIPICSSCKKIRDDEGEWNQVEEYIQAHSQAHFSHGVCPECAQRLYPEFYNVKSS